MSLGNYHRGTDYKILLAFATKPPSWPGLYEEFKSKSSEIINGTFDRTCDPLQSILKLPTSSYSSRTFIEFMYTNFISATSPYDTKPVPNVKPGAYRTVGEAANNAFLDSSAGIKKIHFDKFFSICAPPTCTYTEFRPPSLSELVLLTLALVGGLNSLIRQGVDIFVDVIDQKCGGGSSENDEAPELRRGRLDENLLDATSVYSKDQLGGVANTNASSAT